MPKNNKASSIKKNLHAHLRKTWTLETVKNAEWGHPLYWLDHNGESYLYNHLHHGTPIDPKLTDVGDLSEITCEIIGNIGKGLSPVESLILSGYTRREAEDCWQRCLELSLQEETILHSRYLDVHFYHEVEKAQIRLKLHCLSLMLKEGERDWKALYKIIEYTDKGIF